MEMHLAALAPFLGAVISLIAATTVACFFESISDE
jgi:hypothetical protein